METQTPIIELAQKQCMRCKILKNLTEFGRTKKHQYKKRCKQCENEIISDKNTNPIQEIIQIPVQLIPNPVPVLEKPILEPLKPEDIIFTNKTLDEASNKIFTNPPQQNQPNLLLR